MRFDYASPHTGPTVRDVDPYSLVSFVRRWYLVAWDTIAATGVRGSVRQEFGIRGS
ncbi:WYL domain-containing protein [Streptomyces sp. NPDC008086]|uniref:WYL domain-containing protein n=1 Tax=Streptomyces sp. NPDC008086 TaxID=3364807 RepID=UPI0036E16076